MKNESSLTIIIPTFNSEKYLSRTFECLRNQDCQIFSVLVIDDNSTDNTLQLIRKYSNDIVIKNIIKGSNIPKGAAESINLALPLVTTKYFALIDSDTYLAPNWISENLKIISGNLPIVGAPILAYRNKSLAGYLIGLEIESRYAGLIHLGKYLHLSTCNLMGLTKTIKGIQLDTRLLYAYDHQLSYMLNMRDIKFTLNKNTFCHHHNKAGFKQLFIQQYLIASNHLSLIFKYPLESIHKDHISPSVFFIQVIIYFTAIAAIFFSPMVALILLVAVIPLNFYFFKYLFISKHYSLIPAAILVIIIRVSSWLLGSVAGILTYAYSKLLSTTNKKL